MKPLLCLPVLMLIFLNTAWAQAPGAAYQGNQMSPAAPAMMNSAGSQNPLLGGIPSGRPTPGVLPLSLSDALRRALVYNLGVTLSGQATRAARGARMLALSQLLPRLTTGVGESVQQVNLAALGFSGFPGIPAVIGPFNVFDVRAYVSQPVLDFTALNRWRAQKENVRAAELSEVDSRNLVVFVSGNLYMQAVASSSRIDATRAQVATAQALYDLAVDQKAAGVVPGIEVLRAQVELQAEQQRMILAENQFATDKLMLARAIGLPLGQEFTLTEGMLYSPPPVGSLDESIQRAYRDRPDYQSAQARVRAAESDRRAAQAERLPVLGFNGDYGLIGQRPWENHGTFTAVANLRIPIFQGGSIRAQVQEADAALREQEAALEDLRGRIYYDVQNAFLDLKAAADRVQVAQSALKLAHEQVDQSEDRFRAGVASNIEVVQAQEALATANENYISSLYAHGTAKLELAKAMGVPADSYEQFLRGK